MAMSCPRCGAGILDGARFCGRCGLEFGTQQFMSAQIKTKPAKDNRDVKIIVLVVVLVVVVQFVLPAILYIMVLGFGGTSSSVPTAFLTESTITNGKKFTFSPMTRDTTWGDVTILLSDGVYTASWTPWTNDLDNGTTARWNSVALASNLIPLKVNLSIVDLAGNGQINQGDYFTLTLGPGQTYSFATVYDVTIMYDPTSSEICHSTFQG